jgi:hypothetical protein
MALLEELVGFEVLDELDNKAEQVVEFKDVLFEVELGLFMLLMDVLGNIG